MENSTGNANEAAQSGLRPGHPCGVPPDKPAPPPAQMAGLRPGLFTRARLPPRGALRTAKATRAHRKAVEAFSYGSAGSGKGKRLKRAYGASWRFLRPLKLSCGCMAEGTRRPHAGRWPSRGRKALAAPTTHPPALPASGKGASRPLSSGVQPAGRFASLSAPCR